ncbi:MAG TPA: serine/threonine-protein kinase, partial [Ktedonobacterales bacterium]|nr:serine/threonine-protein kinase [Ktedonobacterales bacterium]
MLKQGPLSGQTLGGKYLLGELLGKGGFGAVYQAQNQMLNRKQAVKVLLEEHFSDEKFRERFLREARTLAALDHANIVHVDDIGLEGHLIYLVMPYISGGTLQDIMRARPGPLGLDAVTRYLEQICSALGYAHAQGIAHLDLKPLNLLVHQDGRLLLSDFGLAHLMEQGAIEGGTSLQFGSPLYMAPEHFDGRPTQRSDVYALGVILYQMLTGRHPFEASTPAAIMRKHLTEPPPPLHLARPDLPVALDAVIGKALAKQEEQRYGRAGELLFDFRAALGGQALQFSGSAEPTQRAQVYLDPTQRVTHPPVSPAGPTLAGVGPAATTPGQPPVLPAPPPGFYGPGVPRPVAVPIAAQAAPAKLNIWTQGFKRLFVLLAIAGGVVTWVVSLLLGGGNFVANDWIVLLVPSVVVFVCLVGLRFVSARLLRAGLLLQIGSLASILV